MIDNLDQYITLGTALLVGAIFLRFFVAVHAQTLPAPRWRNTRYRLRLAAVLSGAMAAIPIVLYICTYSFNIPYAGVLIPTETVLLGFAVWDYALTVERA